VTRKVLVVAVSILLSSSAASQDGLSLLHKMQAALGGADRIVAVRDFEQQVRAESIDGNTGRSLGEVRKRTRWIRPNILRVDQIGPGSTYILYFDGTSGWEIMPGSDKAVEISGWRACVRAKIHPRLQAEYVARRQELDLPDYLTVGERRPGLRRRPRAPTRTAVDGLSQRRSRR